MVMTSMLPEDSVQGKWMKLIYTEAFRRMGIEMVYKYLPAKRATVESGQGEVDGDVYRAYQYGIAHPEFVRVEESVYTGIVSAFVTDPTIQLDGWESLKSKICRVAYRRGVKICEDALPKVVPKERLSEVSLWNHGLNK
jgi:polar amino acid transport system substrate-binding protein